MSIESLAAPVVPVVVFDDNSAISGMLVRFLQVEPGFIVSARARTLAEGLAALAAQPGVVVLDWMLPDGTCLEFLRMRRAAQCSGGVLVYSSNISEVAVRQALTAGASGYLERSCSLSDFVTGLREVAAGRTFLSRGVAQVMHRALRGDSGASMRSRMTPREREVLRLVGEGYASKQIAALFGLSVRTIENHRAALMRKTGLRSAAQLAVLAVQLGLVDNAVALEEPAEGHRLATVPQSCS